MNKAIVFLGICILVAALVIGIAWIYTNHETSSTQLMINRYYFGVGDGGLITSVADKQKGIVHIRPDVDFPQISFDNWFSTKEKND